MKNSIKIISWNVNGIRAVIKKGFYDFVKEHQPDILCLQETKAHPEQVDLEMDELPVRFWNSAEKKGYSGTSIFLNENPINSYNGINIDKHDNEGRVITLEFNDFFLVNVYTPNSKRDLARLDYRYNEWDVDFLNYVKDLEKNKPVIFCGDLNVAHKEIDLKNPKTNKKNAGFTVEEREGFDNIVKAGFIDTFLSPFSFSTLMRSIDNKNTLFDSKYLMSETFTLDPELQAEIICNPSLSVAIILAKYLLIFLIFLF